MKLGKLVGAAVGFCVGGPAGAAVGDQKRVMTPADARQIGSDYIVVGRPITQADDPVAAYHDIKAQWNGQ